jgi:poly-beta-1,6-N-acetyl-D-glucosamine N-deacetylase
VNFAKIRAIVSYIYHHYWLVTGIAIAITPIAIVTLAKSAQIAITPKDPSFSACAMSGVYDSLELLSDRLAEDDRPEALKTIVGEHQTSTWRSTIDFQQPITTERKTLDEIPFVFVSGGRLTTIHAAKPQQVAEIIDRHQVVAGVDGAFFMMRDSESNQLIGPSLSRTDNQFHPGTAYEVMRSAGRPLVLMNSDSVKFIPFDPERHNTLTGIEDELPHATDAFIAAGWLVQKGQPQTLASFGNLYKADEPRYRAFWGFDRNGQPKLGISTRNISAVKLGDILAQDGWQEAVMVDSGQSTSLAYEGKSLVPGYVPRPVPHVIGLLPPNPQRSLANTCQPFNRKSAQISR